MRVLFLTHRLPYPPNRGDRLRAYQIIQTLAPQLDLEVVSLAHDSEELAQAATLAQSGVRTAAFRTSPLRGYLRGTISLPGTTPLTHCLLDAPGLKPALRQIVATRPPDVVLAFCSGMARFALEPPLDTYPMVLDFVDVDCEKWAALSKVTRGPKRWIYSREARHLGRFEAAAATRAAASLVINTRERDSLLRLAPRANVHVVGNGLALDHLRPSGPPAEQRRVVFCGVMNYQPNTDGVVWFVQAVWPLIRVAHPDASFVIVGANPTEAVKRLANPGTGIDVTGTVPDVREYLWSSAVSVAPLLTARGLQNKVLEALAAGLPVVVTPQVAEGLPPISLSGCRTAVDPQRFADHVIALLSMPGAERRELAARPDLGELTWESQLQPLIGLVRDAANMNKPARAGRFVYGQAN